MYAYIYIYILLNKYTNNHPTCFLLLLNGVLFFLQLLHRPLPPLLLLHLLAPLGRQILSLELLHGRQGASRIVVGYPSKYWRV